MTRTMVALATLLLLGTVAGVALPGAAQASPATVRFGMNAGSVSYQTNAGVAPDYGSFWVGPWTLKSGWGGPNDMMAKMSAAGVTPAIHFYYWGDDISPSCVENGCWSDLHQAQKDKAGWDRLAKELVHNLNVTMKGKPVIIFLETEFNKGGIENYDPFDTYLAEKSRFIRTHYPAAETVMALGNWNSGAWHKFDETAAASDYTGIQGMRGSTRDSFTSYQNLYEATLSGARNLQSLFGKPVFIHDVALSTHPEPDYLEHQRAALQKFFTGMPDLKAAGVQAILYRGWHDNPNMDLKNYYGEAERHWGFAYAYTNEHKPAAQVWIDGIKAERAGQSLDGSPSDFTASFTLSSGINEWWVEATVKASSEPAKVEVQVNGGSWIALSKTSWGTWAKSTHAPKDSSVVLRATDAFGQTATSETYRWLATSNRAPTASFTSTTSGLGVGVDASGSSDADGDALTYAWAFGDGSTGTGRTGTHTYAAAGTYTIRLTVSDGSASSTVSKAVTVTKPNAQPTASFTATTSDLGVSVDASDSSDADGDALTYAWTFGDGSTGTGRTATHTYAAAGTYTVQLTVSDGSATSTASKSVTVTKPNAKPVASFSATTSELGVTVDASGSSDVDGDALTYAWAFGDGATGTGRTATHTYAGEGTYTVTLTVSDGRDSSTTSKPITVSAPAGPYAPTFEVSPNVNEWWVEVYVRGAAAPSAVSVRINDGSWNSLPLKDWGSYAKSIYTPAGSKVVFRATDAHGQTAYSQTYTWLQATEAPNQAPTPRFVATADQLTVTLDASGSSDADGDALTYTWDLGDGTTASGQTATHTYAAAGTYTVTLTVSDGTDSASTTQSVSVSDPPAASVTLEAYGYKVKGVQHVRLTWDGATASQVYIYRDGALTAIANNDGSFTDKIGKKGGGSYTYTLYDAGTGKTSNAAAVTF